MGSGKSTIGRALARKISYRFEDLDAIIENRAGKTIAAIFADDGEETFRDLETDCLRRAASRSSLVLATGGGTPVRADNRAVLERRFSTVYLEITLDQVMQRVGRSRTRP
jgi:3-dehydroquinate synthase